MLVKVFQQTMQSCQNLLSVRYFVAEFSNKVNPLQFKILESKSLHDFFKLFDENKAQFNADIYTFANKTLSNLIHGYRGKISFQLINPYLISITEIQVDGLTEKHIYHLLNTLRIFEKKGIHSKEVYQFRRKLTDQFFNIFKDKNETTDINILSNLLFEFTSISNFQASRLIVKKMNDYLRAEEVKFQKINLSIGQVSYILHSLTLYENLGGAEKTLRSTILKKIASQLNEIKLRDLTQIACDLNSFDESDWEGYESGECNKVFRQLLNSITELEEGSILQIFRCPKSNNFNFYKIYESIFLNILNEIKSNGQSSISNELTIKLIAKGSSKISLSRFDSANQQKFWTFMSAFLKSTRDEQSDFKYAVSNKLQEIVSNNFFASSHKEKLSKLIKDYSIPLTWRCIYEFSIKNIVLEGLDQNILKEPAESWNMINVLQTYVSINKQLALSPEKEDFTKSLAFLKQKVDHEYSQAKFYQNCSKFFTNQNFHLLAIYVNDFGGLTLFSQLPNPFQIEDESPETLRKRFFYLNYIVYCLRNKDSYPLLAKIEDKITNQLLKEQIRRHLRATSQEIKIKSYWLQTILRRFDQLVETSDKQLLDSTTALLVKYSQNMAMNQRNDKEAVLVWRLLHRIVQNYEKLVPIVGEASINRLIILYLQKDYKNYNIEMDYKHFVKHLLGKIGLMSNTSSTIVKEILKEGLRLNIVEAKHIANYNEIDDLKSYVLKESLKYIKDQTYITENPLLKTACLPLIFRNKNMTAFIGLNYEIIVETLLKESPQSLSNLILVFNLEKTAQTINIFKKICELFLEKSKYFEKIDFVGMIQNVNRKHYQRTMIWKKVCQKGLDYYKLRVDAYSLQSHIQIIKGVSMIPGIKVGDYLNAVVDNIEKSYQTSKIQKLKLYSALVMTNYEFRPEQMARIQEFVEHSPKISLYLFLLFEDHLDSSLKSKILASIIQRLKKSDQEGDQKETETPDLLLHKVYYNYLKEFYPTETQEVDFSAFKLSSFNFAFPCHDKMKDLLNKIAEITGDQLLEEDIIQGETNRIYRIKNQVYFFPNSLRSNSILDHHFTKKLIRSMIADKSANIICVSGLNRNPISVFEYIKQNSKDFLVEAQILQIQKYLQKQKEDYNASKDKEEEESQLV